MIEFLEIKQGIFSKIFLYQYTFISTFPGVEAGILTISHIDLFLQTDPVQICTTCIEEDLVHIPF